jgi:hypothetical protein
VAGVRIDLRTLRSARRSTDYPTDGRVISVDEFGPLNLLPRTGKGGSPRGAEKLG